ncbi:unnamed protein product, partial [Acanthoscelides obtectus]
HLRFQKDISQPLKVRKFQKDISSKININQTSKVPKGHKFQNKHKSTI